MEDVIYFINRLSFDKAQGSTRGYWDSYNFILAWAYQLEPDSMYGKIDLIYWVK